MIFAVNLNGVQMSSQLSVEITPEALFTSLAGVSITTSEDVVSSLLITSPPDVPRYDALLHIHLESGLRRADVEVFQTIVAAAVDAANDGMLFKTHTIEDVAYVICSSKQLFTTNKYFID